MSNSDTPAKVGSSEGLGLVAEARKTMSDAMDPVVLKMQRDSLRDALQKVLDTHNREAKAKMSYRNARENFSDSSDERKAQERAMQAACDAEREARVLLMTLRDGA